MADIQLRSATATDAGEIASCVDLAYEKWIARIGRKPWPMLQDYSEIIATEQVVVAEVDRRVAGVLVLSRTADGFLIDNVAVLPSLAGTGIGRLLLVRAEREAVAQGYDSIHLYTNEKMTENIALYARAGYREYERRQESGFCRVFMRKSLR